METDKPAEERGSFLHLQHEDHTEERGVAWARNGELIRRARQAQPPAAE